MEVIDYEDLFECAPCGYLVLDNQGRILATNQTLQAWLGYDASELKQKRFLDLLNVAGRIFYETHFAPLLRMQDFFDEVALDFVTRDGNKLAVLANARQRRDEDGDLIATRVAIFQAKERRRYERDLVEARKAAEAARKELATLNASLTETGLLRDEFIAVLGHDLRNPLASIIAGMRMLSREPLSEKAVGIVGLVEKAADRMHGLIGNILDLARGRLGGGLTVKRDATEPLEPALRQVIAELHAAMPDRVIDGEVDIPILIGVDRMRIGQLASNLLANALTHGARDMPVKLKAMVTGDTFVLSVINHGTPIPQSTIEKLFQPFFRGGTSDSPQGLGLGLHIASEIAKAHGGTLTVSSTQEQTAFTFLMPLTDGNGAIAAR
ncbi:PAS domain-containing sensor histidine kinase [Rhizobium sp. TH2]|uniref:PAS domain-containing sensor histidine kinase n=1 Tax=Rhizobium sp. TH2 TaxID=2775403 RepID=UPI002157D946|nr:PAS domain-containing sensor histidine kinase [Rhizobium sp. TH2]UVC09123.1 PAS domain-containing sensor histidine kinase [Rhizobium sp. TH2]